MFNAQLRNSRIDLLRGIAIILVLVLHFHLSYHLDQSALNHIFSTHFINAVASNGNYGVIMFFVISGFLITSNSLSRYGDLARIDAGNFYLYRFARIMPCLLLALTLIVLLKSFHIAIFKNNPNTTSLLVAVFSVLTFWHNVLMQKIGYFNYCLNIYWSLSVEEVFYLAFPLTCLFFKKLRLLVPFWIALIIIGPIDRSFYTDNEIVALYGYLSCFDAIAIGCCAAVIAKKIQLTGWLGKAIQYAAALIMIVVYVSNGIMQNVVIGVSLTAVGTAILLIGATSESQKPNQTANYLNSIVRWFGKNSYELYLFHIIVLALMKEIYSPEALGDYSKLLWMATFFISSALLAGCIEKYYSKPLNQKIRSLFFNTRKENMVLAK